uniref:Uncharacterized protein n=1 Tax=Globodera pallida TaxID=36090 RepID=A0A183BXF4_GLOPA
MQIFMLFLFTLIIPCAFCGANGNEKPIKNGEKKSQEAGPPMVKGSNFLKTAAVGVLALGGGIGLANGTQPAASSGAIFNNNLTAVANQSLFNAPGYEATPPINPYVEYKQPDEYSQSTNEHRQLRGGGGGHGGGGESGGGRTIPYVAGAGAHGHRTSNGQKLETPFSAIFKPFKAGD